MDPMFHYFASALYKVSLASQDFSQNKEARVIGDSGCSKNFVGHCYRPHMSADYKFVMANGVSLTSKEEGLLPFVFPHGEVRVLQCAIAPGDTTDILLSCEELFVTRDSPQKSFWPVKLFGRVPLLPLRPVTQGAVLSVYCRQ
eukprot:GHVR01096482.1.p1 GENE.GHVR01096482.1~~GHVR01096482.1.p1  ORF type:complete len:143 (-),score=11.57 GHVR01096482.1:42-470(-)